MPAVDGLLPRRRDADMVRCPQARFRSAQSLAPIFGSYFRLLFSARIHVSAARLRALARLRSLVLSMKRRMACRTLRHLWWRARPCFQ